MCSQKYEYDYTTYLAKKVSQDYLAKTVTPTIARFACHGFMNIKLSDNTRNTSSSQVSQLNILARGQSQTAV